MFLLLTELGIVKREVKIDAVFKTEMAVGLELPSFEESSSRLVQLSDSTPDGFLLRLSFCLKLMTCFNSVIIVELQLHWDDNEIIKARMTEYPVRTLLRYLIIRLRLLSHQLGKTSCSFRHWRAQF